MHLSGHDATLQTRNRPIWSPRPDKDPTTLINHTLDDQRRQSREQHTEKITDFRHNKANDRPLLSVTTENATEPIF